MSRQSRLLPAAIELEEGGAGRQGGAGGSGRGPSQCVQGRAARLGECVSQPLPLTTSLLPPTASRLGALLLQLRLFQRVGSSDLSVSAGGVDRR